MEIILAEHYGFCFGVKRAVYGVFEAAKYGKVTTLGPVTHNKTVITEMTQAGISITDNIDKINDGTIIIRAHGVAPHVYDDINAKGLKYVDLTCPCVAANQKMARKKYKEGKKVIIIGDAGHPEIIGINGWAYNKAIIIYDKDDVDKIDFNKTSQYFVMSQTTFDNQQFTEITAVLLKKLQHIEIAYTICKGSRQRQEAAAKLAANVDKMIVIGDKGSANSVKLYEISKKIQKNTFFVESIEDLELKNFCINDKIGITAGASTPPATIKEAIRQMSELEKNAENIGEDTVPNPADRVNGAPQSDITEGKGENFEAMLEESITSLHTGQVVKGKVISIVNGEVMVDLQYKSDGIIQKGHFAEGDVDPATVVSPGDDIEVYVLRVNDGDGNVLLSKKRIDAQKGYRDIEAAHADGTLLSGKIIEVVKGGVIAKISGVRTFVPSSQVAARFIRDLTTMIGQEHNFAILEMDKSKRPWRIIAGRKDVAAKEAAAKREAALSRLAEGEKVTGKVSNVAKFGAFVDLDGVDGLIHVSELSWGRVRNVSEVLKEGDTVEAYVIRVDREKGKVSLTLRDISNDPWRDIETRFPIGGIVEGKVVRMVPFGAFVELAPGVDGLVHISQIAHKHVAKPDDELKVDQIVQVKVTEMSIEKKKISLSIKEAVVYDDDYYDDEYDDDYDDYDDYDDDYEEEAAEVTETTEE